jgi:beta-lactamase superfamily II metal-dependent hydrolase
MQPKIAKGQEKMTFKQQDFPDGVIYARVDQLITYQDYAPYAPCLRLIGVDASSFENRTFNGPEGCQTFLIDINLKRGDGAAALKSLLSGIPGNSRKKYLKYNADSTWLMVRYKLKQNGISESYGYALFQNAAPTYLEIQSIQLVTGPAVIPPAVAAPSQPITRSTTSPPKELLAFHVGQGMCSVLQFDNLSYLIDAGAGTPVRREAYTSNVHKHGGTFANELTNVLAKQVHMVLSHPDSDHWRLLDWDAAILKKITEIFVPDNVANIVLSDKSIKPKLVPTTHLTVRDPAGARSLEAYRSQPIVHNDNGECLVVIATVADKKALLPGDYAYVRMARDNLTTISGIQHQSFDAVVVPHHGDLQSASAVVKPTVPHQSIAFFSAGNHLGYHHPRAESLTAHHQMQFNVISKKWIDNIIAVKLL